jgi:antitoxin (DNA-binding transcriptional repressor) of toxin-antitoxin stability system
VPDRRRAPTRIRNPIADPSIRGEEITISRAGRPVAKLVPLQAPGIPRRRGLWRGRVVMHDDFDELPEDIASAFRGEAS